MGHATRIYTRNDYVQVFYHSLDQINTYNDAVAYLYKIRLLFLKTQAHLYTYARRKHQENEKCLSVRCQSLGVLQNSLMICRECSINAIVIYYVRQCKMAAGV